jgi:hypothetical protein
MTTSKLRTAIAVLAAVVTVMAVGLPAAPAGAAIGSMTATLTTGQTPASPPSCLVTVLGQVRMTQTEAQGLMDSGHKVWVRVWGDDPLSDDLIREYTLTPVEQGVGGLTRIWANSTGLSFRVVDKIPHRWLDEDGFDPAHRDEVYAGVRLLNSNRTTIRSAVTNQVSREFAFQC